MMTRCAGSDVLVGSPFDDGGPAPCPDCGAGVTTYVDGPAGHRLSEHVRPVTEEPALSDLIQTANGYLICSRHAEAWQRGGNDVSTWPANRFEAAGGTCADCADENARTL